MLIINADDFGLNSNATQATLVAFAQGLCSSATIVANGSDFSQAAELAHAHGLAPNIGIHLNLVEGVPLSEGIRQLPAFCTPEGEFNGRLITHWGLRLKLTRSEQEAIAQELRAQIAACRHAGLALTHADSHQYAHTRWEVWQVIAPLLKEQGINKVRLTRNCGPGLAMPKLIYKKLFNNNLRRTGFVTTDFFGSVDEVLHLWSTKPMLAARATIEVMVHPRFNSEAQLIDLDSSCLASLVHSLPNWEIIDNECPKDKRPTAVASWH